MGMMLKIISTFIFLMSFSQNVLAQNFCSALFDANRSVHFLTESNSLEQLISKHGDFYFNQEVTQCLLRLMVHNQWTHPNRWHERGDQIQIVEREVAPRSDEIPRGEQSTLGSAFVADFLHLDNQATTVIVPFLSSSSTKREG
jgi:hypothetical protein